MRAGHMSGWAAMMQPTQSSSSALDKEEETKVIFLCGDGSPAMDTVKLLGAASKVDINDIVKTKVSLEGLDHTLQLDERAYQIIDADGKTASLESRFSFVYMD